MNKQSQQSKEDIHQPPSYSNEIKEINSLLPNIIGRSSGFIDTLLLLKKFSRAEAPVLICGETGTGKEIAARACHYLGPRRHKPFIPVSCATFPDNLIESELFGHNKGAFTDAKQQHLGLVKQAEKGTLFLDEVDSLSFKAQACLLRFLQERTYRPVGSSEEQRANIHVISATNADLLTQVKAGKFREDLYYRLDVARVSIPPLRERREDILLLAENFLKNFKQNYNSGPSKFTKNASNWMFSQDWPGNVRQLENWIHREFLKANNSSINIIIPSECQEKNLPLSLEDFQTAKKRILEKFEKKYLTEIMSLTNGNVTAAALLAKKERRNLGRLLKKHGINKKSLNNLACD